MTIRDRCVGFVVFWVDQNETVKKLRHQITRTYVHSCSVGDVNLRVQDIYTIDAKCEVADIQLNQLHLVSND